MYVHTWRTTSRSRLQADPRIIEHTTLFVYPVTYFPTTPLCPTPPPLRTCVASFCTRLSRLLSFFYWNSTSPHYDVERITFGAVRLMLPLRCLWRTIYICIAGGCRDQKNGGPEHFAPLLEAPHDRALRKMCCPSTSKPELNGEATNQL
jgi:hypothetical protein